MSWLSIPNPFKSVDENPKNDDDDEEQRSPSGGAGVKEDLSELGKTIGRQLWGVASFLAPPPAAGEPASSAADSSSSQGFLGIRNDFAEIGGSFKSMISTTRAVNEISKMASNLLQFDDDDDDDDVDVDGSVGVTKEVLEFAREMSARPECWIDFPLPLDDFDFEMSDIQREHTLTVGDLVPGLVDLKSKICPSHMNEGHFWIVYFILLLPRLNKHNLEMLSTSQVLEARELLLQKLQNSKNAQSKSSKPVDVPLETRGKGADAQLVSTAAKKQETLIENVNTVNSEDEDVDQWLEEDVETGTSQKRLGNEQDVSFSDLEDDDDNDTSDQHGRPSSQQSAHASSPSGSSGWVQLSENSKSSERKKKVSRDKDSEGESSNDWQTVDDFDSDSVGAA
ncbi:hypothetical protein Sjap_011101 [Stephania japonica]|uniref:BSD domain-containing protein n=1 Tax=Stephania japonica TaxID=461633 RepID=A0AAP0P572_9MAGN